MIFTERIIVVHLEDLLLDKKKNDTLTTLLYYGVIINEHYSVEKPNHA